MFRFEADITMLEHENSISSQFFNKNTTSRGKNENVMYMYICIFVKTT